MKRIKHITPDEAFDIVKEFCTTEYEDIPEAHKHLFIAIENGKVCAIDNTDGNCWVEDFNTLEEAVKWLLDIE